MKYIFNHPDGKDVQIIHEINTMLFKAYFDFEHIDNVVIYKIVFFYCEFYAFALSTKFENCSEIVSTFLSFHKAKDKKVKQNLFRLFISLNSIEDNNQFLIRTITQTVYLYYFKSILTVEPIELENILEDSFVKEHNFYMKQIVRIKENYNIYKGCIALITEIYEINSKFYPFISMLNILVKALESKQNIYSNSQIIVFVTKFIDKTSDIIDDELLLVLDIINIICEKEKQNDNFLLFVFNKLSPHIKLIMCPQFKNKRENLLNKMSLIIDVLSSIVNFYHEDFFIILQECCFSTNYKNYELLLEHCVSLSFAKITKVLENEKKSLARNNLSLINNMRNILQSENELKTSLIEGNLIKYYTDIINKILKENPTNLLIIVFSDLVIRCIIHSKENYKKISNILFTLQLKENDLILKERERDYFISTYIALLSRINHIYYIHIISYVMDLSFSKQIDETIEGEYEETKQQGKNEQIKIRTTNTISLLSKFLDYIFIKSNGEIIISNNYKKASYLIKSKKDYSNDDSNEDEFYYLDIDSIVQEKINILPNTNVNDSIKDNREKKINQILREQLYKFFFKNIQTLYLFSSDTLTNLLVNYIDILNKEKDLKPQHKNLMNFLFSCNYFLNFSSQERYLNSYIEQKNEIVFSFDKELRLKDKIVEAMLSYTQSGNDCNLQKDILSYNCKLLCFYINSSLDQTITNGNSILSSQITKDIDEMLSYMFYKAKPLHLFELEHSLLILTTLYNLKEILKLFDNKRIIQYVYIILIISRPNDFDLINKCFEEYTAVVDLNKKEVFSIEIPLEYQQFYFYFSDILCCYYLSYLNDDLIFYSGEKEENKCDRKRLYASLTKMLLKKKSYR